MNIYNKPFGGILFLGLGDFRQVAPVVSGAGESPSLAASMKSSQLWKKIRVFALNTSICSVDDPEYTRTVDDIGEDFSGERHCFIEVQIPNTTKIYCPRITFSFNPQGSSWTVNHRQIPLRARYATTSNGSQGL